MSSIGASGEGLLFQLSGLHRLPVRHSRRVELEGDTLIIAKTNRGQQVQRISLTSCYGVRKNTDGIDSDRYNRRFGVCFLGADTIWLEAETIEAAEEWTQRIVQAVETVFLSTRRSALRVRVISASNLMAMDRGGTSDPYVTVAVGTQSFTTKTIPKSLSPVWNDTFFLEATPSDSLIFNVADFDRLSADDFLGSLALSLQGVTPIEQVKTYALGGVANGDLTLGIAWVGLPPPSTIAPPTPADSQVSLLTASSSECRICMERPVDSVLLPCAHSSLCFPCAQNVQQANNGCPICRTPIEQCIKIFNA